MPHFTYQAVDLSGHNVRGTLQEEDRDAARRALGKMGYQVLRLGERGAASRGETATVRGQVKLRELMVFTRQFQAMVSAGVGIVRSLEILEEQTRDLRLRAALGQATREVSGGNSLTEALARHPRVFSTLYVSMIRAAEAAGTLDAILQRLAAFLEKQVDTRQRIQSALMYPVIVFGFAILITNVLVFFILPKFDDIFRAQKIALPTITRALIAGSRFAVGHWYVFPLVLLMLGAGYRVLSSTAQGRRTLDGWKLRIPIVGDLFRKMAVSRFASTLATLQAGGVPIVSSLEIVSETAGNAVLAEGVMLAQSRVRQGQRIAPTLATTGVFPTMVTQMMTVGEETGELGPMLLKISEFYDADVDATIKGLTSILEPVLIIALGLLVMVVALSVITPIYSLVSGGQQLQ